MFAVIYQTYLKPHREQDYQKAWHKVASYFVQKRGALGSCLHKTREGLWVAYSRWPDQATRDASWPGENAPSEELPEEIRKAVRVIQECMDQERKIPDICLEVINDLLIKDREFHS
jgi:hypothetical protein